MLDRLANQALGVLGAVGRDHESALLVEDCVGTRYLTGRAELCRHLDT